jgi:hypothetical protein
MPREGLRLREELLKMTDPDYSEEHLAILRAMTPEQKFRTATALYWSARRLKAAWLRSQHPDWSEEEIQRKVREIFLYART